MKWMFFLHHNKYDNHSSLFSFVTEMEMETSSFHLRWKSSNLGCKGLNAAYESVLLSKAVMTKRVDGVDGVDGVEICKASESRGAA